MESGLLHFAAEGFHLRLRWFAKLLTLWFSALPDA